MLNCDKYQTGSFTVLQYNLKQSIKTNLHCIFYSLGTKGTWQIHKAREETFQEEHRLVVYSLIELLRSRGDLLKTVSYKSLT